MRITDLYNLKHNPDLRKKIAKSLINDIENLAESKFENDEFQKFSIKFKLERISKYI